MTKFKAMMLTLALFMVMHTSFLFAQPAMSWPMQQGERVGDIARLFYPKNPDMQRQFVAATLKLNQNVRPNVDSKTVFAQGDSILVPDIKWLSRFSKDDQAQATVTKKSLGATEAAFPVSATLQQQLEDLIQKNAFLKQQLEALTAKLARLEAVFSGLKADLLQLINKPEPVQQAVAAVAPAKEPVSIEAQSSASEVTIQQPQAQHQQQNQAAAESQAEQVVQLPTEPVYQQTVPANPPPPVAQIKPVAQVKPTAIVKPAVKTVVTPDAQQFSSLYWIMPLLIAVLIIGLFFGLDVYNKRWRNRKSAAAQDIETPLNQESFDISYPSDAPAEFTTSLPHSKFSDSILQLIPDVEEVLDEREEADLMLNQAKIYDRLKRYDNAARLLKAYIKAVPKSALPHRFLLLDIYHRTGQEQAFLEVAQQLHQAFNVEMLQWKSAADGSGESPEQNKSLEDYDHIVNKVTKLWMDCEKEAGNLVQIKAYIDKLLTDNRDSQRTGFSADVFDDLMLLRDVLIARERLTMEVELLPNED